MAPPKRPATGEEPTQGRKKRTKSATVTDRVTRSASRKSAMDAVFLTTELHENILQFLPMKDLLLAQRVSRDWKAAITESLTLQQMLFFKSKQPDFCWVHDPKSDWKWPKRVDWDYKLPKDSAGVTLLRNGQINPMLFETGANDVDEDWGIHDGGACLEPLEGSQRPAMSYAKASWRRMLFSQPPIKHIMWEGETMSGEDVFRGSLMTEQNFTCAQVVGAMGELWSDDFWMCIYGTGMLCPLEDELALMLAEQDTLVGGGSRTEKR